MKKSISRRDFVKMVLVAPVVGAVSVVSSNKEADASQMPKALLIDPYLVSMPDIRNIPELRGVRIVRLRRSAWGRDIANPIRKIF